MILLQIFVIYFKVCTQNTVKYWMLQKNSENAKIINLKYVKIIINENIDYHDYQADRITLCALNVRLCLSANPSSSSWSLWRSLSTSPTLLKFEPATIVTSTKSWRSRRFAKELLIEKLWLFHWSKKLSSSSS